MAAKKKGLSIEEKVERVEEYFHDHQIPFTMKELEQNIPKAKGVIYQSVQECVNLLVAENRVQTEKVGVHVLFWHFEGAAKNQLVQGIQSMEEGISKMKQVADDLNQQILLLRRQKGEGPERAELETQETNLKIQAKSLSNAVDSASECDAVTHHALVEAGTRCRDLANRWTDNIFLLEAAVKRRTGMSNSEFRSKFGIPRELDFSE